jgi:O-antigen/teichoic acid export membrane protein
MQERKPTLTEKAISGAGWNYANKFLSRALRVLKLIVLARLLSPDDFGLFGIVTATLIALRQFSSTGINLSLVQNQRNTRSYLDAAWTVEIIRGCAAALLLYLAAPPIGAFFDEPRVVPLLRVMSLCFIADGFKNVGVIYFQKELQFHRQFVFNVASVAAAFCAGVFFALKYRSVWALVFAELTEVSVRFVLSYVMHPYRPVLRLDFVRMKKLLNFGKWVLATNITIYVGGQLDNVMVGKFLGAAALGYYAMAFNISMLSIRDVTYVLSEIAFPSYAKLQGDRERLKKSFGRVFQLSTFMSLPACVGLALVAPVLVDVVLGDKWHGAVLPLQILMFGQLLKSIASTGSPLFVGTGKPDYEFHMQIVRAIGLAVFVYPLMKAFGVPGVAMAVVASAVLMLVQFFISVSRTDLASTASLALKLAPVLCGTALMSLFVLALMSAVDFRSGGTAVAALKLAGTVSVGALFYLAATLLIGRFFSAFTVWDDLKLLARSLARRVAGAA